MFYPTCLCFFSDQRQDAQPDVFFCPFDQSSHIARKLDFPFNETEHIISVELNICKIVDTLKIILFLTVNLIAVRTSNLRSHTETQMESLHLFSLLRL